MNKYNIEELIQRFSKKNKIKYLFFWGHKKEKYQIKETCFSQWYEEEFEVEGIKYKTAEHWMMAEKARLFNDNKILEKIIKAKHPGEAKKLGRLVRSFKEEVWNEKRMEIVVEGNFYKFCQNENLKNYLLNTGEKVIVEASPYDKIWGIGLDVKSKSIYNPIEWKGENLLGFALMEVRDRLRKI